MSEFDFPLLIASIDASLQLSIPEQAQNFFASSVVKPSSPAIIISCFNSTSFLLPNLLNTLLSSCAMNPPTSPGLWLRHVYQQDEQAASSHPAQRPRSLTKGAVASPARDDNSGTVILLLDVIVTGLNQVWTFSRLLVSVAARNLTPFRSFLPCRRRSRLVCLHLHTPYHRTYWPAGEFSITTQIQPLTCYQRILRAVQRFQLCSNHRRDYSGQRLLPPARSACMLRADRS
jgi:hypothetical protein